MASRISKTEWKILVGLAVIVDGIQIILDFFGIGIIVNRFIDVAVGIALPLYLQTQGVSMANPKRLLGMLGAFVGEMIPVVDSLPLWTADVLFTWSTVKAEELIAKAPGGKMLAKKIQNSQNTPGPSDEGEVDEGSNDTDLDNIDLNAEVGDSNNSPQRDRPVLQDIRPRL